MAERSLSELVEQRARLYAELAEVGDFRRGSVSENYRRCGKPNCGCADRDHHRGHGPRYLWTRTVSGRSRGRQLSTAEVGKVRAELEVYDRFAAIIAQIEEVNEQICEARPVSAVSGDRRVGPGGVKGGSAAS